MSNPMCNDCNKPVTAGNAVSYEGYRLCWSCYELWEKADEEARKA